MSPNKSSLTVGLTALGLFGFVAARAADPVESPAPPGPPPAPASAPTTHTVLLKTNGDLLTGPITREGDRYLVHKSSGPIPVPKSLVENTFDSVEAAYLFKLAQVPERDPDEHLKLARWCLSQNLRDHAKAELKAVLRYSPRAREAVAMLASIEATEAREAQPRVDAALVQTRADVTQAGGPSNDPRPAELDAADLRRARNDLGVSGLPVIFDLPPAVAAKRADSFARNVHPILLAACARCHNEGYQGTFQLIEVRSRRGLNSNLLRANLDATLRLIDQDNPARSELLSRSLVPHGKGPNNRPIFRGSNDFRYQVIAAWVNSLKAGRSPDGVVQAQYAPTQDPKSGGFAVDRVPGQGPSTGLSETVRPNLPKPYSGFAPAEKLPATRYVPGQGMVTEKEPPSPGEFPAPYMLGGPRPDTIRSPAPAHASAPTPTPPGAGPSSPPPASQPGDDLPSLPQPSPSPPAATAKPKKPLNIDPDLLQKALINRNGTR